jgi:hypothetical protein
MVPSPAELIPFNPPKRAVDDLSGAAPAGAKTLGSLNQAAICCILCTSLSPARRFERLVVRVLTAHSRPGTAGLKD